MNKQLSILPAFRYSIKGYLKSSVVFVGIIILVFLFLAVLMGILSSQTTAGSISGGSFEFSSFIFLLVIGIVAIREDLRMLIQHGLGRRTCFISSLLCAAVIAMALAIFAELLSTLLIAISANYQNIAVSSFTQMLFQTESLSFAQHLLAVIINFSIMLCSYFVGMFCSLVFYRLPKYWKLVVAIGVPAFFVILMPLFSQTKIGAAFFAALSKFLDKLIELIAASSWYLVLFVLIIALVVAGLCFLLIRRADIQPSSGQ